MCHFSSSSPTKNSTDWPHKTKHFLSTKIYIYSFQYISSMYALLWNSNVSKLLPRIVICLYNIYFVCKLSKINVNIQSIINLHTTFISTLTINTIHLFSIFGECNFVRSTSTKAFAFFFLLYHNHRDSRFKNTINNLIETYLL